MSFLPLNQFCDIFPGLASSGSKDEEQVSENGVKLLRGQDISAEGVISLDTMKVVDVSARKNIHRQLLQTGDIVLMSRGSGIRLAVVNANVANEKVVAFANFIVIRPSSDHILPEALLAYFESSYGHKSLMALNQGAALMHIPTAALRELEVPIPSPKKQEDIKAFYLAAKTAYVDTLALAEQQKQTSQTAIDHFWSQV
jgi:hypothetical protein